MPPLAWYLFPFLELCQLEQAYSISLSDSVMALTLSRRGSVSSPRGIANSAARQKLQPIIRRRAKIVTNDFRGACDREVLLTRRQSTYLGTKAFFRPRRLGVAPRGACKRDQHCAPLKVVIASKHNNQPTTNQHHILIFVWGKYLPIFTSFELII